MDWNQLPASRTAAWYSADLVRGTAGQLPQEAEPLRVQQGTRRGQANAEQDLAFREMPVALRPKAKQLAVEPQDTSGKVPRSGQLPAPTIRTDRT